MFHRSKTDRGAAGNLSRVIKVFRVSKLLTTIAVCAALLAPTAASAEQTAALTRVLAQWDHDPHPDLKAVVVLRRGHVEAERYYNGETPSDLHDVRSAGKSITALLVGAALDRGRIGSVADRVDRYWPAAKGTAIGDAPLADVLTMRSGLAAFDADPNSPGGEDKLDAAPDPLAFILALPRSDPPGSIYHYNSVTAHVAGLVVEGASGEDLQSFAEVALFAPLAITRWSWTTDASGHFKGQGNLSLTARDFAKIGQMVLDRGTYAGRRVLSARWIDEMLTPRADIRLVDPYADGYGYFWYVKTQQIAGAPVSVVFASGNGGNKIYVVKSLGLVVAITSSAYGKGYGQRRSEDILKAVGDCGARDTPA